MSEPLSLQERLARQFPGGQFLRYIAVGIVNTLLGYVFFVATLALLNHTLPTRFLYPAFVAVAASVISTPVNITISYFNYKLFVFRTHGNYLQEWLKAFGVYGVSMLPGLLALAALTRLLQSWLHGWAPFGKGTPGYIAGAITTGCSTILSFLGHRNVTFRAKSKVDPASGSTL